MRTAEETFRQANDPNGEATGNSTLGGGIDGSASTSGAFSEQAGGAGVVVGGENSAGAGPALESSAPTILFRESSTLFRRASVSFCRRLGEADGSLLETDIMSLQVGKY